MVALALLVFSGDGDAAQVYTHTHICMYAYLARYVYTQTHISIYTVFLSVYIYLSIYTYAY